MADWPREKVAPQEVFITNIEEWVRRSGLLPTYSSAAIGTTNGVQCPIIVPAPMTVLALYCLNGSSVASNCQMALSATLPGSRSSSPKPWRCTNTTPFLASAVVAQAGVNQWQKFDVTPTLLAAGQYWIEWGSSGTTGQVQRLFTPNGASTGEASLLGGIRGSRLFPLTNGDSSVSNGPGVVPILALGGIAA